MMLFWKLLSPFLALRAATHRALRRYRMRRAMIPLLRFDERMLRDIGLSRFDVISCLHFAEPEDLLDEHARRQAVKTDASAQDLRDAA